MTTPTTRPTMAVAFASRSATRGRRGAGAEVRIGESGVTVHDPYYEAFEPVVERLRS
jgi:hypothetical protein